VRPVRRKLEPKTDGEAPESETEDESDEDDEGIPADIIPETQYDELNDDIDMAEFEDDFDPEKAAAEEAEKAAKEAKATARAKATRAPREDPSKARNKDGTTPRKKAADRNNYCKLKIKNKNSKANGRGRFGKRR
jgi:DNA replication regulator SLD2